MESLGNKIRTLRETKGLLLRQAAAAIEIDQGLLSKIERGERIATRNQVILLADLFEVKQKELLTLWLGEKIAYEIKDESVANEALKVAEEAILYFKKPKKKLNHV